MFKAQIILYKKFSHLTPEYQPPNISKNTHKAVLIKYVTLLHEKQTEKLFIQSIQRRHRRKCKSSLFQIRGVFTYFVFLKKRNLHNYPLFLKMRWTPTESKIVAVLIFH